MIVKEKKIIDNVFAFAGFTSGCQGVWSRNEPDDPATSDYVSLSSKLGTPLKSFIRPYQAGEDKVEIVGIEHGGSGVIKDNDLKKVDGLITAESGIVLSVIAADCVPVYLFDEKAGVIGLLHCGWKSASGALINNAVECMRSLGAVTYGINIIIGPHICADCYEVGAEVYNEYDNAFNENELSGIFENISGKFRLDLTQAICFKAMKEGIPEMNISAVNECTCHDTAYYSYRRGDRGKQNLAYIMMK